MNPNATRTASVAVGAAGAAGAAGVAVAVGAAGATVAVAGAIISVVDWRSLQAILMFSFSRLHVD